MGIVTTWDLGRSPYPRTGHPKTRADRLLPSAGRCSRGGTWILRARLFASPPLPVRRLSAPEADTGPRHGARRHGGALPRVLWLHARRPGVGPGRAARAGGSRSSSSGSDADTGCRCARPTRPSSSRTRSRSPTSRVSRLLERMEAGFNVYYTFREGESAWIYAQVLKLCRQVAGVESFSIDPYQVGRGNDEAIDSGAFWFYRKLGFRPTDPRAAALVAREERRLAARPTDRTPKTMLRHLAAGNLLYEVPDGAPPRRRRSRPGIGSTSGASASRSIGAWRASSAADAEAIRRRLGAERRAQASGPASRSGTRATARLQRPRAGARPRPGPVSLEREQERADVVEVIRAKAGRDETRYLKLSRRHARLRAALIRLGS